MNAKLLLLEWEIGMAIRMETENGDEDGRWKMKDEAGGLEGGYSGDPNQRDDHDESGRGQAGRITGAVEV